MLRRTFHWCHRFCTAGWDVEFAVTFTKRKLRRHLVRGALLAVPLALLTYGAMTRVGAAPHDFSEGDCTGCHVRVPSEGEARPFRFVDRVDVLCGRCHEDVALVGHVVDVAPTVAVPPDLPLDEGGRLSCATCHAPHGPATDPNTGARTYLLREGVAGKGQCAVCHPDDLAAGGDPTRRPAMNRAHGFSGFTVLSSDETLDGLSATCLDCHDNPRAVERTAPGAGVWRHGSDLGLSHPIGFDYANAARRTGDLRPLDDVQARLVLFDGKVGCCTCHDPYRPGGALGLRVGTGRDYEALCLTCHVR